MAEGAAIPSRSNRTICLPVAEAEYRQIVGGPRKFRPFVDHCYACMPELIPADFTHGYD